LTVPLVSRWIERLLAGHEPPLTVAQYLVLQAVDQGGVVGSELARRAAVSPAAVSQLLVALESGGLLERHEQL
jgi:DNA-binding MarR family transcriptional regulator